MRKTKDAVVKMTDRLNPEAFLAAKDAGREAFQANKDWHDITTAMLSAYDKSLTAYLAALTEPDSTLITDELTRVAEALHGDDCPDDPDPGEACTCDGDTYYRMAAVALEAAALPAPRTITTVEQIPATIQVISWEEEPEHECWKLSPNETFVGLIVKSERSWSPADQYTLRVERTPAEGGGE